MIQRSGADIIAEYFDFYRGGADFDIYHIKAKFLPKGYAPGTIELAVLRKMPKGHAHHHPGPSWFYPLDNNCALNMGGACDTRTSVLTRLKIQAGTFYPVPPFVFHAAGPWDESQETRLLIFNPQGLRKRPEGSNYAVDTHETPRTVLWHEVLQETTPAFMPPPVTTGYTRVGMIAAIVILAFSVLLATTMFRTTKHQDRSASLSADVEVAYKDFLRDCDLWLVRQAQTTGDVRYLAKVGTPEAAAAVYGTEF